MEVFLTLALMYGITFSLKDAKLLNRPREFVMKVKFFEDLLTCPFCTGFHSGWISFLLLYTGGAARALTFWMGLLVYGFVGAAVSYVVDVAAAYLERY